VCRRRKLLAPDEQKEPVSVVIPFGEDDNNHADQE
jgi:hypothetical protein